MNETPQITYAGNFIKILLAFTEKFKMAGIQIPSNRSIFTIIELREFWNPLNKAGLRFFDQILQNVDKLEPLLSSAEKAKKVIKVIQSLQEVCCFF